MSIHSLVAAMETLLEQHEQLLEFAEQRNRALMENDINRLTEIVTKESRLAKQVVEAEEQRQHAVEAVSKQLGLKLPEPTVSQIVQYITNPIDKKKVGELVERLLAAIAQLKKVNDINRQLLEHALEINNFSLDLLTGSFDQDYVYQKPSHSPAKTKRSMYDSRA